MEKECVKFRKKNMPDLGNLMYVLASRQIQVYNFCGIFRRNCVGVKPMIFLNRREK